MGQSAFRDNRIFTVRFFSKLRRELLYLLLKKSKFVQRPWFHMLKGALKWLRHVFSSLGPKEETWYEPKQQTTIKPLSPKNTGKAKKTWYAPIQEHVFSESTSTPTWNPKSKHNKSTDHNHQSTTTTNGTNRCPPRRPDTHRVASTASARLGPCRVSLPWRAALDWCFYSPDGYFRPVVASL